jgi:RNA polymerase sigma-70 factor (ECF subfamily)
MMTLVIYDVTTLDGLTRCYDETFDETYRVASRLTRGHRADAEDLVQDAFIRLTRAAKAGQVTEVGVGWLVTTIRRRFVDRLRSNDREARRLRLVRGADRDIDAGIEPSVSVPTSLLDGLSDRERAALVLRYVEDLSVAEVADLMSTSVRATESLLQRAKRKVRAERSVS